MRMAAVAQLAAGASSVNVIAGKLGEFLDGPSVVTFSGTGTLATMFVSISIGRRVIVDDEEISAAARYPILPDDLVAVAPGAQGERIVVRFRNGNAAANTYNLAVDVSPI
jgi:hypothetical protein